MIISTNNLNNIENKITTPQIEGIEFINTTGDLSENPPLTLQANYNDLINILQNNKLPIIKISEENNILSYSFIEAFGFDSESSQYAIEVINNGFVFTAPDATTNFSTRGYA